MVTRCCLDNSGNQFQVDQLSIKALNCTAIKIKRQHRHLSQPPSVRDNVQITLDQALSFKDKTSLFATSQTGKWISFSYLDILFVVSMVLFS